MKILKIMFVLVVVGLVLGASLPWWPVMRDAMSAGPYKAHLAQHKTVIESADDFVLVDTAYGPGLVMLGEMHGFSRPQELDLKLAQHLAVNADMRWYIAELDPMQSFIVNAYFDTGDDSRLRDIFDSWSLDGAQWANLEFFAKLQQMRAWMIENPDHAFRFIGIDAPQHEASYDDLDGLVQPDGPESIGLNSIENARALNLHLIREAMKLRETDQSAGRYSHMLNNLDALSTLPGFEDQTFYGFWGLFHVMKARVADSTPLAMHLNREGGLFEGRVTSILTTCVAECFNMMPAQALPGVMQSPDGDPYTILPMGQLNPYLLRFSGVDELMDAMEGADSMLFHLNTDGSPFATGQRLLEQSGYLGGVFGMEFNAPTAETIDYMLVMQDVEALTPWRGKAYDISRPDRRNP